MSKDTSDNHDASLWFCERPKARTKRPRRQTRTLHPLLLLLIHLDSKANPCNDLCCLNFTCATPILIMTHLKSLCGMTLTYVRTKCFLSRSDQKTVLFGFVGLIRQVLTTFLSFLALSGDGEQLSRVQLLVTADRGSMSQLRDSQGWSKNSSG